MATNKDTWAIPAIRSPDGENNLDSLVADTWAPLFIGVTAVFVVLATVCVLLKLYIRLFIHKQPGLDDLCVSCALVLQVAATAMSDQLFVRGGARHQWDMSPDQIVRVMKVEGDLNIVQMPTYLFTKLALLYLYHRLFAAKRLFKWAVRAGCTVVVVAYLALMFIFIFAKDFHALILAQQGLACLNLITDVYLWLLPLAAVSSLHLSWDRKIGVAALFSAGALACTMSALSLYNRFNVDWMTLSDWTYDYARCMTIIFVEIYTGIIVACVPVFPSLLRKTNVAGSISKAIRSLRERVHGAGSASYKSHKGDSGTNGTFGTSSTATAMSRRDPNIPPRGNDGHDQYEDEPLEHMRPSSEPSSRPFSALPLDSLYEPSLVSERGEEDGSGARDWRGPVSPV